MGLQTIRKTAWLGIMAGILWLALITAGLGGLKISAEEADGSVSASKSIDMMAVRRTEEAASGNCFMSIPRRRDVTVPSAVRLPYMETAASGRRGMHTATAMDRYMKYIRMSLKNTAPRCSGSIHTDTFYRTPWSGTDGFKGYDSTTHTDKKLDCSHEGEVTGYEMSCGETEGAEVAVLTVRPDTTQWTKRSEAASRV